MSRARAAGTDHAGHMTDATASTKTRETCDECGFDADEWPRPRAIEELKRHADAWAAVFTSHDVEALRRRPEPSVWSAVEYAVHTARVVAWWNAAIATNVAGEAVTVDMDGYPDADVHPYNDVPPADAVEELRTSLSALASFGGGASDDEWAAPFLAHPKELESAYHRFGLRDAGTALLHALHDCLHHLDDVERGLATT